ncbi:MAG: C10 family peptidase [Bacteroidetes bacterium]|nr:C10 family peptidase [Bacteroidota bacterium]
MKKFTLIVVLLIIGATFSVFAEKVDSDQASQVAKNFYFERINISQSVSFDALTITGELVISENEIPAYYVFSINAGYIIVTADDRVYPVIGYSFDKPWDQENVPSQLEFWMNVCKKDIFQAIEQNYPADQQIIDAWELYSSEDPIALLDAPTLDVEPLITDTWNQDFPNNAMCPEDAASGGSYQGHVPVGCVATAMSQIMHYWRYPETGQGSHCIVPEPPQYGPQCADFGATTYDWNGMTDNPNKECDPLALISWHCGIAVNMEYDPTGSGAYVNQIPSAMRNYFKYATAVKYSQKSSYPYNTWLNMMKDDLDQGMPIEYSGHGTGGHAWVCDGYQGNDFFHMNWGWGGYANGYFYLNALNPGGNSFNNQQGMVYNIEPNPALYPEYCSGQTDLVTYDFGALEDGSGPVASYMDNSNCSWLIAPDDSVESITLDFIRFDLATGDEVNVYDGNSAEAPLLGTYTGSSLPPSLTGTVPEMFVTFTTNGSGSANGFLAEYDCNLIPFCESATTFYGPNASFSDGSGNYEYRNSTICKWYIQPDNAVAVILDFTSFNTQEIKDKVQVYDLISGQLLGTFSGNLTPPPTGITATSGRMMVMWSSNIMTRGEGWDASYSIVVGTEESEAVENLYIYPNPASNFLNVKFKATGIGQVTMELVTLTGRTIYSDATGSFENKVEKRLDLSGVAKGVYILRLSSKKGVSNTKVIVR